MSFLNGGAVDSGGGRLSATNRVGDRIARAARNVLAVAAVAVFTTLAAVSGANAQLLMECIPSAPYSAVTGGSFGNVSISIYDMSDVQGVEGRDVTFSSPASGGGTSPSTVTLQTDFQAISTTRPWPARSARSP